MYSIFSWKVKYHGIELIQKLLLPLYHYVLKLSMFPIWYEIHLYGIWSQWGLFICYPWSNICYLALVCYLFNFLSDRVIPLELEWSLNSFSWFCEQYHLLTKFLYHILEIGITLWTVLFLVYKRPVLYGVFPPTIHTVDNCKLLLDVFEMNVVLWPTNHE